MKINIIGMPIMYGCDCEGPNLAPDTMREQGLIDLIRTTGKEVYDLGNIYIPKATKEEKLASDPNMKYFAQVHQSLTNLAEIVSNTIASSAFPLIIGGDHSLGLGTVAGASSQLDNLAVIWIDAHGDINTHLTSPSKNMHGMPLAALIGEGDERLVNLYYDGAKIKSENVFLVACRSLDEGELKLIEDRGLNVYTMETIRERGIDSIVEEIQDKLTKQNVNNVHISLDIDAMDPKLAPGTGTDVKDGMNVEQLYTLLANIIESKRLKSMGLVELNPLKDDQDMKTTHLCLDIVKFVTQRL